MSDKVGIKKIIKLKLNIGHSLGLDLTCKWKSGNFRKILIFRPNFFGTLSDRSWIINFVFIIDPLGNEPHFNLNPIFSPMNPISILFSTPNSNNTPSTEQD